MRGKGDGWPWEGGRGCGGKWAVFGGKVGGRSVDISWVLRRVRVHAAGLSGSGYVGWVVLPRESRPPETFRERRAACWWGAGLLRSRGVGVRRHIS